MKKEEYTSYSKKLKSKIGTHNIGTCIGYFGYPYEISEDMMNLYGIIPKQESMNEGVKEIITRFVSLKALGMEVKSLFDEEENVFGLQEDYGEKNNIVKIIDLGLYPNGKLNPYFFQSDVQSGEKTNVYAISTPSFIAYGNQIFWVNDKNYNENQPLHEQTFNYGYTDLTTGQTVIIHRKSNNKGYIIEYDSIFGMTVGAYKISEYTLSVDKNGNYQESRKLLERGRDKRYTMGQLDILREMLPLEIEPELYSAIDSNYDNALNCAQGYRKKY